MRLIDADAEITALLYDEEHEETQEEKMSIADFLDSHTIEGCPQNGGWISVKDKLPPEKDTFFARLKGTDKWRNGMFEKNSEDVRVVFLYEDGTRGTGHSKTIDGVWECEKEWKYPKRKVTHWLPNPELPPEEEENGITGDD